VRHRQREAFARELRAVPVFAVLDEDDLAEVAANATRAKEPRGMTFSREGERGDELVVVLEGSIEVRHGDVVVATLGSGDIAGEMALVTDTARRNASLVAVSPVVVAYLSRHHFDALVARHEPFAAAVRATIAARGQVVDPPADVHPE
jgi:CRP/FNR family transcriptional regulator, cyclic AMP receptor protein